MKLFSLSKSMLIIWHLQTKSIIFFGPNEILNKTIVYIKKKLMIFLKDLFECFIKRINSCKYTDSNNFEIHGF